MIIDAHQHFWNPARGDYFWMQGEAVAKINRVILPPDMAGHLAKHGISKTVLVQAAPTVEETEYMLGLADCTPHIAKVVGWIDFEKREDNWHLARWAKHPKFAGVRPMIQDLPDVNWMMRKDVQWAFDAITDLGLTFDALGFPIHLDSFRKIFSRYPNMRIVIDHCMKPVIRENRFDDWAAKMKLIAEETGVFCKLSGIATEAKPGWTVETLRPYAEHVLEVFGSSRVMWGSDWPVLDLNGSYDSWFSAAQSIVPEADKQAVFGKTSSQFYDIK